MYSLASFSFAFFAWKTLYCFLCTMGIKKLEINMAILIQPQFIQHVSIAYYFCLALA